MKKIISFSLWGDNPKYTEGAVKNAELQKIIYPDWICRFYTHSSVPENIIERLRDLNCEIEESAEEAGWGFTMERFLAIDDENVERVIFRDADSRLSNREKEAVEEWISKKTHLHVMRDHPYHGSFPILAGMFGLFKKDGCHFNMESRIKKYKKENEQIYYHFDQDFLWSFWRDKSLEKSVHDSYFSNNPFPSERISNYFVGESFGANDERILEHVDLIEIL